MLNEKKISKGGGITIPAHIRRELGLEAGDKFAITTQNGNLTLERITGSCIICGEHTEKLLKQTGGKYICVNCAKRIAENLAEKIAEALQEEQVKAGESNVSR